MIFELKKVLRELNSAFFVFIFYNTKIRLRFVFLNVFYVFRNYIKLLQESLIEGYWE